MQRRSQSNFSTLSIEDCVIVIKSGSEVTTLHKALRQAYEIIFYILQHGFDHIDEKDIPKLPATICIETKEREKDLWGKVTFGSCVLFEDIIAGNQIFDSLGNITCKNCEEIVSVELPSESNHFKARFPVILIHVKIVPHRHLRSNLISELSESLEVITQGICDGDDIEFDTKPPIRQAVITKQMNTNEKSIARICLDGESTSYVDQMYFFSELGGMIACDNCDYKYNWRYFPPNEN